MSKLPNVGATIFSTMSKLASEHNAINLSQGFPNFPVDEKLTTILEKSAKQSIHQYAPMTGNPVLMQHITSLIASSYSRNISVEEELLITAGATQAIFTTIVALIQPGEEVIILDPSYDCYEPAVLVAGGIPIRIPLTNDFLPNWDRIENAVSSKTKMIITNNPHNPSGRVWSESDLTALETIAEKHEQLLILSDEVYEFITFEKKHISVHSRKNLIDKSIVVSSFGKTFHITGWKTGYLVAPKKWMDEIKKVHQFNVFSVNSVAQYCLSEYVPQVDVASLGSFYQDKRDFFRNRLIDSSFKLLPCEGTYFQLADYAKISSKNDVDFCTELTIESGVAAIPISVFNAEKRDQKIIRFCFAKDNETLIKATDRLCRI